MIPVEQIHPMIIHFPIVFILCLAAFDVIAAARGHSVTGRNTAGNISTALMVLAALSAVAAMMFGDLALSYAESKGFSSNVAEIHESLGGAVAATFGVWAVVRALLWWRDTRVSGAMAYAVALVAVVGAGLAATTAYFGGQLVYDLGVNVANAAPIAQSASE